MTMENNNLENNNEDMCEVCNPHEDAVERVKGRMPGEEEYAEIYLNSSKYLETQQD